MLSITLDDMNRLATAIGVACDCRERDHWVGHKVMKSIGTGKMGPVMFVVDVVSYHDGFHGVGPNVVVVQHKDGSTSNWHTFSLEKNYY